MRLGGVGGGLGGEEAVVEAAQVGAGGGGLAVEEEAADHFEGAEQAPSNNDGGGAEVGVAAPEVDATAGEVVAAEGGVFAATADGDAVVEAGVGDEAEAVAGLAEAEGPVEVFEVHEVGFIEEADVVEGGHVDEPAGAEEVVDVAGGPEGGVWLAAAVIDEVEGVFGL